MLSVTLLASRHVLDQHEVKVQGRTHNGLSTHLLLYCCTRHVGVVVEFLVGLRPRTLGHCFLRSRPIQHIILPDLHRLHGIGVVFFHYLCQAWSWFSMLHRPFPFLGHRYSLSIFFVTPSSRCPDFDYILYTFIVWCVCCHV